MYPHFQPQPSNMRKGWSWTQTFTMDSVLSNNGGSRGLGSSVEGGVDMGRESFTFAFQLFQGLRLAPHQSQEFGLQLLFIDSVLGDHQTVRGQVHQKAQLW